MKELLEISRVEVYNILLYVIVHDIYTLEYAGISWYGDMT